ncbi:MAG: prolyl oligopeptidase family serine peptidase [Acidobacteria bacterium]|nr:prolyl oligopeptidase family serine peptidase [Acidobacteriota bacterium]
MRRAALFLLTFAVSAQDADLALRTLVAFTAMRNTVTLAPEKKDEIAALGLQAQSAARAGDFGEAIREYAHAFAVMQGYPWSPETELAAALQAAVDDAIADQGQQLQLTFTSLYKNTRPAITTARIVLRSVSPGAAPVPLAANVKISSENLPLRIPIAIPAESLGNYEVVATLGESDNPAYRNILRKAVPIHVETLAPAAAKLKARLAKESFPTAEYALRNYELAEQGKANPHRTDFAKSFEEANRLLDAAAEGKDPFKGRTGDLRKAYRSKVDQTLQPYRLFIPANYDVKKASPLVIALHGMGGSENSIFDGYNDGALKVEAEKYGFIVACPKGREPASMYRGAAETDVLDVLAEVRRDYSIDPKRIYLMGHSMGAYGTWSIAMNHPDIFAALGPISGGGDPRGMTKLKDVPQYVVHGDNDRTVPVAQSRMMVEAGRKAGAKIEYVEVPNGSHVNIAIPNFAPMFDFFAKHAK